MRIFLSTLLFSVAISSFGQGEEVKPPFSFYAQVRANLCGEYLKNFGAYTPGGQLGVQRSLGNDLSLNFGLDIGIYEMFSDPYYHWYSLGAISEYSGIIVDTTLSVRRKRHNYVGYPLILEYSPFKRGLSYYLSCGIIPSFDILNINYRHPIDDKSQRLDFDRGSSSFALFATARGGIAYNFGSWGIKCGVSSNLMLFQVAHFKDYPYSVGLSFGFWQGIGRKKSE